MSDLDTDFPEIPRSSGTWMYWVVGLVLWCWGLYLLTTPGPEPVQGFYPLPMPVRSASPRPAAPPTEFRLTHVDGGTSPFQRSLTEFSHRVAELTEGRVLIRPLPRYAEGGRRLGELEMANRVAQGQLEMTLATTSPLSNLNSSFDVLDLPFLVQSYPQAEQVLDGPIGRELLDGLAGHNLKGLGYLEIGFRVFSSSVPMPDLASFQGKRIRVMESPTCLRMARALGAQGVACPPDRVYQMCRDGFIDAADRTIPSFWDSRLYEVQPYITRTRHLYSAKAVLINGKLWDQLSPDDQSAVRRAAAEMVVAHRLLQRAEEERVEEHCRERRITLFDLTERERQAFVEACAPLYAEYRRLRSPELLRAVEDTPR